MDDRKKRRDLTEKLRKERIKEREDKLLQDFMDRMEKRKNLVKQKIDSKKLVELVKISNMNRVLLIQLQKQAQII